MKKGDVSFPLVVVVTIIVVIIILVVFFFFFRQTANSIENNFSTIISSLEKGLSSLLGPIGSVV